MPTPNVASAVTRAICLCSSSSPRGMNSITSTPTSGRKTPTLSSQFWSVMTSMGMQLLTR